MIFKKPKISEYFTMLKKIILLEKGISKKGKFPFIKCKA